MKKLSFKELFLPGIILFSICVVTAALLAWTNELTTPKIEALAAANADTARKKVLTAADSFNDQEDPLKFNGETYEYFEGLDKDLNTVGYVFITVTKGYGGDVKLMTGVGKDGTVTGVEILQLTETPGLGMKAYENFFLTQFLGKDGSIAVVKSEAGGNSIRAITGATITSNAVAGAINIALELFDIATGKADPSDNSAADADENARKLLLPTADSFDAAEKAYFSGEEYNYYTGKDTAGKPVGYLFETPATGYNGIILVNTAVDSDGIITGVKVVAINDTPGIGTQVKDDSFITQFIGKSGKVNLVATAAGESSVQVITGATISSGAVVNAVNTALELYKSIAGGTP